MKKLLAGLAASLVIVAAAATTAHADDHLTPGTPGTPSCKGQTTAYLAQAQKNGLLPEALHAMGIGGIANEANLSVKEVHDVVDQFCGN